MVTRHKGKTVKGELISAWVPIAFHGAILAFKKKHNDKPENIGNKIKIKHIIIDAVKRFINYKG